MLRNFVIGSLNWTETDSCTMLSVRKPLN